MSSVKKLIRNKMRERVESVFANRFFDYNVVFTIKCRASIITDSINETIATSIDPVGWFLVRSDAVEFLYCNESPFVPFVRN
jgi:hypothetical protein